MKVGHRDKLKLLAGFGAHIGLRAGGLSALAGLPGVARAQSGGTLKWVLAPEPPTLNTAFNSSFMVQEISTKMLDGLVIYGKDFEPNPSLATGWEVAPDGLSITFKLRDGVKWHDGAPFTSADVKYTFEEILRKHHPRGRATFANLAIVEVPDRLTAVLRLSKPSAYIMAALSASESPMLPKHLYEKGDPTRSPLNNAPVGTGPFKFAEWQRGRFIRLVRNPDYWAKERPGFDTIIAPFTADPASRAVGLETGEIDLGGFSPVPLADLSRVGKLPNLAVTTEGYALFGAMHYFEFNMRDPQFQDVRVRQAFAHAIDREFVAKNICFGYASPATGPVSQRLSKFYTPNVPRYPYDPKKAEALLDAAGFGRKAGGVRMSITHDPSPYTEEQRRFADYFKQAMRQVGIEVEIRMSDAATFQRRVWTENSHQTTSYGIFNMPDPTIGVQRIFWSKNIRKGVPYTNGSGYTSEEMDRILETAQSEKDAGKRRELFNAMQALAMKDLPVIPILNVDYTTVYNKQLKNVTTDLEGMTGTFATLGRG